MIIVIENHGKRAHLTLRAKELRLHFEWTKVIKNTKNGQFWLLLKTETCGQTVLPDR